MFSIITEERFLTPFTVSLINDIPTYILIQVGAYFLYSKIGNDEV